MRLQKQIKMKHQRLQARGAQLRETVRQDGEIDAWAMLKSVACGAFFAGFVWYRLSPNGKVSKLTKRMAMTSVFQAF